ncbi:MAG TPA: SDR family oxidoreductase [Anaerolineales bacterium]|nr:SDR family oxidoreductase [Anaerolineales bacterium]
MKILIIGGTKFLGRHLVDAARAAGHEVTLFNRGKTNPALFSDVETITGDREHDMDKLSGREWDAVIDVAGYLPRIVRRSAEALKDSVRRYVFISSISVYADNRKVGIDESYPVGKLQDESVEEITGETYGPLKALAEKAVQDMYGDRAIIVRPGLIVGPYDPTDRFTYWPMRVKRGGDVITPDKPQTPIQIIDVRDLSGFIIRLVEDNASGVYNATGPDRELMMGEFLDACKRVAGSVAAFHWASVEFLAEHGVQPWSDMPVWIPDTEEDAGFSRIDVSRAIGAGLTFRPLEDSIRDTIAWAETRPENHEWRAGLNPDKERILLTLLKRNDQ